MSRLVRIGAFFEKTTKPNVATVKLPSGVEGFKTRSSKLCVGGTFVVSDFEGSEKLHVLNLLVPGDGITVMCGSANVLSFCIVESLVFALNADSMSSSLRLRFQFALFFVKFCYR
jgi:hypothetical protein